MNLTRVRWALFCSGILLSLLAACVPVENEPPGTSQGTTAPGIAITLHEAIDLSASAAYAWHADARLFSISSIDVGELDPVQTGWDGRRRVWQAAYVSPTAADRLLTLQIVDGQVSETRDDVAAVSVQDAIEPRLASSGIDSPQAVDRVRTHKPTFTWEDGKGQGLHFTLSVADDGRPLLTLRGADRGYPARIRLDLSGQIVNAQIYGAAALGGVLYSPDAGVTWAASTLTERMVWGLAADPIHPDTVYAVVQAGVARGLYRSSDGGVTWQPIAELPEAAASIAVFTQTDADSILLVGAPDGLWQSDDQGATWQVNPTLPPGAIGELAAIHDPATGKTARLFVNVIPTDGAGAALYASADLNTWSKSADGVVRLSVAYDHQAVAATQEGQMDVHVFDSQSARTLTVPAPLTRLAGDMLGPHPLIADSNRAGEVFRLSREATPTWQPVLALGTASLAAAPDLPQSHVLLAGGFRTGIYRSQDGGSTWVRVMSDPSMILPGSNEIAQILFVSSTQVLLINGGRYAWQDY